MKGIRIDREIDRNVGILVSEVYLRFRKYFNRMLRDTGLTATQVRLLISLFRQEGLTQTQLADLLDMGKSPVGKKIDALEVSGWIIRRPDRADRRVKRVYLTDKFYENFDQLQVVGDMTVDVATKGLGLTDVDRLIDWLTTMRSNLDRALEQ